MVLRKSNANKQWKTIMNQMNYMGIGVELVVVQEQVNVSLANIENCIAGQGGKERIL